MPELSDKLTGRRSLSHERTDAQEVPDDDQGLIVTVLRGTRMIRSCCNVCDDQVFDWLYLGHRYQPR